MTKTLLYDGGCSACSGLAKDLKALTGGRLELRDLSDPQTRALLDAARPGWRHQPMLLKTTHGRPRVLSGLPMTASMARSLGIRRSLSVLRRLSTEYARPTVTESTEGGLSRRTVLWNSTVGVLGLLTGSLWLDPAIASAAPAVTRSVSAREVQRLEGVPAVRQAISAYGTPDWSTALYVPASRAAIPACGGTSAVYVLPHADATYTGVAADGTTAISYRLRAQDGVARIEWLTPDGAHFATFMLGKDGVSTTLPATGAVPNLSTKFYECFTNCAKLCYTQSCAFNCGECVLTRSFSACATCGACAGATGVKCAKQCKKYF